MAADPAGTARFFVSLADNAARALRFASILTSSSCTSRSEAGEALGSGAPIATATKERKPKLRDWGRAAPPGDEAMEDEVNDEEDEEEDEDEE